MPLFLLCLLCFLVAISVLSPAAETSAIHQHLESHFQCLGCTPYFVVSRQVELERHRSLRWTLHLMEVHESTLESF